MKLNAYLLKATVVAALGGLLFGFDTAVISGTTHALSEQFNLTASSLGFTVSMALWGTVVGSLFAGIPGDRYGRRASTAVGSAVAGVVAVGSDVGACVGTATVGCDAGAAAVGAVAAGCAAPPQAARNNAVKHNITMMVQIRRDINSPP